MGKHYWVMRREEFRARLKISHSLSPPTSQAMKEAKLGIWCENESIKLNRHQFSINTQKKLSAEEEKEA